MVSWRYLVSLPAAILLLFGGLTLKVSDQRALAFEMPHNQGPLTLSLAKPLSSPSPEPKKPVREKTEKPKAKHQPEHQPETKPLQESRPTAETQTTVTTSPAVKPVPTPVVESQPLAQPRTEQARTDENVEHAVEELDSTTSESHASAPSAPVWVDKPKFMKRPKAPSYPRLARRRGMEGVVMIEVLFNRFGEQLSLEMVESSGFGALDDAALTAVRDWQFAAPSDEGDQFIVRVPVRFALN
ncbi:energy transducer TonB [Shewanella corallii]|uniref:Energy transducer TonB n=1 Tax=Shewanella corallii TaxID=560080 RepID=A0ABT0N5X7_9GAMM|nr:energy transducer TonB [Shewanella corallii]